MAPTGRLLLSRTRVGMTRLLGVLLTVLSGNALALGLGEIELDSALNEELDATIELIDVDGLASAEILVNLASNEDFERVGVERFFFLTDLEFSVAFAADGSASVVVESSRPITEPYLNFIVEVLWPNGRLLKEYTLLLDPPTFSQASAPVVSAPVESSRSPASSGRVQRQESVTSGTRVQVAPSSRPTQPSPLDQDVVGDTYQMTDRDDTLWSIAARTRPSSQVSVHQNMLAIQRLNPEAFINGNINLLKAGYRLRLPDEGTALTLSQNDAVAAVADQNQAWRRGDSVASAATVSEPLAQVAEDRTSELRSPVDATAAQSAPAAAPATDGELTIVAGQGDSATGRAAEAGVDTSEVLEENDRLTRELEELTYQRERDQELVADQLTVKDRQLEVKDKQIAELQQQLADLQAQPAPAAPAQTQNQSTTDANWWENPLVLYGGAGALVLALAGFMLNSRRRKNAEEDFFETTATEPTLDEAEDMVEETAAFESFDDDEDTEERFDAIASADDDNLEEEQPGSETSDVIGEADIYIAYGRYPQAIGLLLGVLEDDPARNDVRLKLLELYSETNDRQAFDEHLSALVEHCDDEDALLTARELEGQFGEKAISLDEVLAEDEQGESNLDVADAAQSGDSLSLDDTASEDGLTLDSTLDEAEEAGELASLAPDNAEDDAEDIGFELELDDPDTEEIGETTSSGDELGGDLGINFDPDRDVADDAEAVALEDAADEPLEFEVASGDRADENHISLDALDGDLGGTTTDTAAQEDLDTDIALAEEEEDEFDFQEEGDSANTKLDLARAYIDMGDSDGARDILKEVVDEGNSEQQQQARGMLESL